MINFTNLNKYLTLPREEFTTIQAEKGEPLSLFLLGDRLEQLGKLLKDKHREAAVLSAQVLVGKSGDIYGDSVTVRTTPEYTFSDDYYNEVVEKASKVNIELKALKASADARKKELIKAGKATVVGETSTLIVSKK